MLWWDSIAKSLLLTVVLEADIIAPGNSYQGWQFHGWSRSNAGYLAAELSSSSISNECASNQDAVVRVPRLIQGSHEIYADGKLVSSFGDPEFRRFTSFFGSLDVPCRSLVGAREVVWRVTSYADYWAHIRKVPQISAGLNWDIFFGETVALISAGGLLLMSTFSILAFSRSIPRHVLFQLTIAGIGLSSYILCTVAGVIGFNVSMLTAHKIADISAGIGTVALIGAFSYAGIKIPFLFNILVATISIGIGFILLGGTGDAIQFGSTLCFPVMLLVFMVLLAKSVQNLVNTKMSRRQFFQILSFGIFVGSFSNDLLAISGVNDSPLIICLGFPASFFAIAIVVNEKITDVHAERDWLRANLEEEVDRKTIELSEKSIALEATVKNLSEAREELIHSEKLASLGTMAAGIAHEINNSLNYIQGALPPLKRMIDSIDGHQETRARMSKLMIPMQTGVDLATKIVSSLRIYTGKKEVEAVPIRVVEVVDNVLVLIASKLDKQNIRVQKSLDLACRVMGSQVSLHQILSNLIGNAVDASRDGGVIEVIAEERQKMVDISIVDHGSGIDPQIASKIFDPFFTMKDVGKGTGLGLYIVRKEISDLSGEINFSDTPGGGATFKVTLPKAVDYTEELAGAA